MSYYGSTTWTIGRLLDRLHETGEEVVVYAGHHAHRGVVRAVGEHLLTLQSGDDVLAVRLSSVSSVQLVGGTPALGEPVRDGREQVPRPRRELPAGPSVSAPAPAHVTALLREAARRDDERIAAETARRTEELQEWLRQLRDV